MQGGKDLDALLQHLSPELTEGEFVFLTVAGSPYGSCPEFEPVAAIMEKEGLTLVIPRSKADEFQLGSETTFRCITLTVHSSLEAVGLTAAVATKLTEHGISANVIAGSFHDHLFVPSESAEHAMSALAELSA